MLKIAVPHASLAKEGVRMQLGFIITQLARTRVKEGARELAGLSRRPPWRVRLTVQLAIETFEAEAREAIAAFVSGNDVFVSLPTGYG